MLKVALKYVPLIMLKDMLMPELYDETSKIC